MTWPKETIPAGHNVFMRVHINQVKNGKPIAGAFKDHEGGMSTDWDKYRSAGETQRSGRLAAGMYGVVELMAGLVREIEGLTVEHEPLDDNRAHSEVLGEKTPEVRVKLLRVFKWAIQPVVPPGAAS